LTGGNISVAQAYITDITDEKDRAKGLGLIGAAFGLGFIIGPAMGGLLSSFGRNIETLYLDSPITWQFALPAFTAMTIACLNMIAVYFILPESLTEEKRLALSKSKQTGFSVRTLRAAFSRPRVGPLLLIRLFFSLAFATFQTIFPLYALNRFELGVEQTAYILTYVGFLVAIVQGVAVGCLTKTFEENWLIFSAISLMTLSLSAWALTPSVPILLLVLAPLALAGGVLNTVLNSVLTKAVLPEEVGGTLGLSASLESLSRVISPTAGGLLLETLGSWAPGMFGAMTTAWLSIYAWRYLLQDEKSPILNQT
jgi:DHA1 family tetracycline resistance protein-like MFS transporter